MLVILLKTVIVQRWDTQESWRGCIIRLLCSPRGESTAFILHYYLLKSNYEPLVQGAVGNSGLYRPAYEWPEVDGTGTLKMSLHTTVRAEDVKTPLPLLSWSQALSLISLPLRSLYGSPSVCISLFFSLSLLISCCFLLTHEVKRNP